MDLTADVAAARWCEVASIAASIASEHAALAAMDARRALAAHTALAPDAPKLAIVAEKLCETRVEIAAVAELDRQARGAREAAVLSRSSCAESLTVMRGGGLVLAGKLLRECEAVMEMAEAVCTHQRPSAAAAAGDDDTLFGALALTTANVELTARLRSAEVAAISAMELLQSCAEAARATLLSASVVDEFAPSRDVERSLRCMLAALLESAPRIERIHERCRAAAWTGLCLASHTALLARGELDLTMQDERFEVRLMGHSRREGGGGGGSTELVLPQRLRAPPRPMEALLKRIELQMELVRVQHGGRLNT
jgi:hypothetical protein